MNINVEIWHVCHAVTLDEKNESYQVSQILQLFLTFHDFFEIMFLMSLKPAEIIYNYLCKVQNLYYLQVFKQLE